MGESEMSAVESSTADSSTAAADSSSAVSGTASEGGKNAGGSSKTALVVVVLLVLVGIIGVIAYLASSPKAAGDSEESGGGDDDAGHHGSSNGGGYPPFAPAPPALTTGKAKSTAPSHTTMAPTAPTPPTPPRPPKPTPAPGSWPTPMTPPGPFSVGALICTVNGQAIYANMLPKEDLCTALVFCHVTVRDNGIYGTDNKLSFETFKKEMSKRKKTAGVSFDIRYTSAAALGKDVDKTMQELANNKIGHYGVLNVLDSSPLVKAKYTKAKELLGTLKRKYVKDARRRTMLAIGILNFLGENAHTVFQELFKDAIDNNVADIVIALSTVSTIERQPDCYTFPPGVWDLKTLTAPASKQAGFVTDLKTTISMMDKTKTYNTSSQVGFSIELGTLGYLLTTEPESTANANTLVNSKCDRFFLTTMDAMPCKADYVKKKVFPDVNVAIAESNRSYIFLYEDEDSIKYKAQKLKDPSTNLRDNMAVLLMDVNLGNFIKGCSLRKDDPFSRISVTKTEFGIK